MLFNRRKKGIDVYMNNIELIDFWIESSDRDYESMIKNYGTK